jgi:phenylacetate-coenzyme A ligase PaaK-like adenylate-forming protein
MIPPWRHLWGLRIAGGERRFDDDRLNPPRTLQETAIPALEPATGDYEIDRRRHLRARRARLSAETELLTWPLERLQALRDERLRALLHHARERSPWHAERLAGIDLDRISGADLSSLPTMIKADLMANWDRIVADPRLTLESANRHLERVAATGEMSYVLDEYHVFASGGSTGQRAVIAWDFDGFLHHHLAYSRVGLWRLRRSGRPVDAPGVVATVYAVNPVHISAALARCFATDRYAVHLLSATRPLAEIVTALNAIQPTNLATYPSMLHLLARRARAGALRIRPWRITTNGEPLLPETAAEAETEFGVRVENGWGTTETAPLAYTDGVNPGLVVCEDKTVLEPVDEENRPVAPGRRAAKVLATNVVNRLLPLIRYEITDQVTFLDEPNPGPWTGRRIGQVLGRLDEGFSYPGDVEVHPFTFRAVLGEEPRIAEYQVRQTERGADVLVCPLTPLDLGDLREIARRLERALAEAGVEAPSVAVRAVESLDRHRETGKLRRFVPLP